MLARDTQLVQKILGNELLGIMLRCLVRYRDTHSCRAGKDFWSFAPAVMLEQRDQAAEETNHFTSFVANVDDFYQCIFEEGGSDANG